MVVIEVYRRGSASTKKVASFWTFLYIWGYDWRSSFQKTFFLEGGFIYFHVTRALGRLTRRTSAKAILDRLAQGLLVLSVVLLAQVENLDIIVNPFCMWEHV